MWFKRLNTLRPRQNGRHFADDIFKRIFFNENVWISIKISLKFVHKGPINKIPALVQIMAWHRIGDKPLSELMLISLSMHICVTQPQWVNKESEISQIDKLIKQNFSNPLPCPGHLKITCARRVRRAEAEILKWMKKKQQFGLQTLHWSWIFFRYPAPV